MKTLTLLLIGITVLGAALPASAQSDQGDLYFKLDYMKVCPTMESAYLDLESGPWKSIHQARLDAGMIVGWYVYRIHYPYGTAAEYTHATVTVYDSFEKVLGMFPDADILDGEGKPLDIPAVMEKTLAARQLVKSELWTELDVIQPDAAVRYLIVNYMKATDWNAYLELEQNTWKAVHQAAKEAGARTGWGLYQLLMPGGDTVPYNFAAVDLYENFGDIVAEGPDIEGMDWDALTAATNKARSVVSSQLWEVIDLVVPPAEE